MDPWGPGSSEVWRDDVPEAPLSGTDLADWEKFDLVVEAQRLAFPLWPGIARRLGAADGQIGIPRGVEGEIPPAIAQVRHAGNAELTRVHDAFIIRKQWLRAEVRRLRLTRQHHELGYLEQIAAYHRSSEAAPLEPRFSSLDEARGADTERQQTPEPIDTRAQADLARNWFVAPVWYWLSTVVLIGAELPLSYTLAHSIIVETGAGWLTSVAPWMLAISMTMAILVTVKLSGTLLRRAQTLLQLRADVFEQAGRPAETPEAEATTEVDLGKRAETEDPADATPEGEAATEVDEAEAARREAEVSSYTTAGYLRVAAASVLVTLLVITVLLLAQFRGEAFASITRQETALTADAGSSIDAETPELTVADIKPDVGPGTLSNLFLGLLLLSTLSGVVLAWVSTDPKKEMAPSAGREDGPWWHLLRGRSTDGKQDHRHIVKRIDKMRSALLEEDFGIAGCEEALKQLDERGTVAHERIVAATSVAEAEYWKANQAWRHDVLEPAYLLWLTRQLETPGPPPAVDWTWEPPKPSDDWDPKDEKP